MNATIRLAVVSAAFVANCLAQSDAEKKVFEKLVKDSNASPVSWNAAALNGTQWPKDNPTETIAITVPAGKQVTITSQYRCAWESMTFTVIDGKRDQGNDTGRYKNGEDPVKWSYANLSDKDVTIGLVALYKKGDNKEGGGLPFLYYEPSMVAVGPVTKTEFTFELHHGGQKAKDEKQVPNLRVVVAWTAVPPKEPSGSR